MLEVQVHTKPRDTCYSIASHTHRPCFLNLHPSDSSMMCPQLSFSGRQILAHRRPPGSREVTLLGNYTVCREIGTKNLGICTMFLQVRANVGPAPPHTVTLKSVDLFLTHRYFDT